MVNKDHYVCVKKSKGRFLMLSSNADDILVPGNDRVDRNH